MFSLGLALSVLIGVSLGFFGGGGSILTVPLLVYVFGLEPKQAIASSLLIVGVASVSGAFQHWRAGQRRARGRGSSSARREWRAPTSVRAPARSWTARCCCSSSPR